jgi:hypothetical protein
MSSPRWRNALGEIATLALDEYRLYGGVSPDGDQREALLEGIDRLCAGARSLGKNQKIFTRLELLHALPDERGPLVVGNKTGQARRPPEKRALNQIRAHDANGPGNNGKKNDGVDKARMIWSQHRSAQSPKVLRLREGDVEHADSARETQPDPEKLADEALAGGRRNLEASRKQGTNRTHHESDPEKQSNAGNLPEVRPARAQREGSRAEALYERSWRFSSHGRHAASLAESLVEKSAEMNQ